MINLVSFSTVAAPITDCITLSEAKAWIKLDSDVTEDDTLITALISAAQGICQSYSWMQFVEGTFASTFKNWESIIKIYKNPVSEIVSIKYFDESNVEQTLATSKYSTDLQDIATIEIKEFPTVYDRLDAIKIIFKAGYASASVVPDQIKTAVKMTLLELYSNRQNSIVGQTVNDIPMGSKYLLNLIDKKAFL